MSGAVATEVWGKRDVTEYSLKCELMPSRHARCSHGRHKDSFSKSIALLDTRTSSSDPVKKFAPAPSWPSDHLQPGVLDKSETKGQGSVDEDVHAEVSPALAHPDMLAQLTAKVPNCLGPAYHVRVSAPGLTRAEPERACVLKASLYQQCRCRARFYLILDLGQRTRVGLVLHPP